MHGMGAKGIKRGEDAKQNKTKSIAFSLTSRKVLKIVRGKLIPVE